MMDVIPPPRATRYARRQEEERHAPRDRRRACMISRETTLERLLDEHPVLVDVLVGYHPHFAELRDPQMRKVLAPRVTIAQAARMAGVAPEILLDVISRAVGESISEVPGGEGAPGQEPRPPELTARAAADLVHVDVRDDIRRGNEPFARIMGAVKDLGQSRVLVLRAPFEPFPLYDLLGKRGFAHWTERHADDDWSVWFYRAGEPRRRVIDVRGLEPPQPMVLVLEAADRLQPGDQVEVIHDRRPMFLFPQLEERGLEHETDEPEPGMVRIVIRRKGGR